MSLRGSFSPQGDKSVSHRAALFALLASGKAEVENYSQGADCQSSLQAIENLGCNVERDGDKLFITGAEKKLRSDIEIDCGNSGTTIRLLMGILAGVKGKFTLTGDKYLSKRPMERIAKPLRLMNSKIETTNGSAPITINGGNLTGTEYELPVASAQLKSAILLAGLSADSSTTVIEPIKSRDHTELMLKSFGADIETSINKISVNSSAITLPEKFYIPGDPSSAAFFLCAAAIIPGSEVKAKGILLNPTRIAFIEVLKRMGAEVIIEEKSQTPENWGDVTVRYNGRLIGCEITKEEIPSLVDEIPVLSLLAALAEGKSVFNHVGELRVKETDRVEAVKTELNKMGANIQIEEEENDCALVINGIENLHAPEKLDSYGDHRMAMTLRLALLSCKGECCIAEEECTSVSYPDFHNDLKSLLAD